jgi:hypothetical protein
MALLGLLLDLHHVGPPLHQSLGFIVHGAGHHIAGQDHVGMRGARGSSGSSWRPWHAAIDDHRAGMSIIA